MFTIKDSYVRNLLYWAWKIFIPNIILASYILGILYLREDVSKTTCMMIIGGMVVYFVARLYFYYYKVGFFLWNNLKNLRQIINEFKKGKFSLNEQNIHASDNVSEMLQELLDIGRQFDLLVATQSEELKKFHEIYSNIVKSINSTFIVIDKDESIIYANDGFCKKFAVDSDRIVGKSLNAVFYFINTRLKMGIAQVIQDEGKEEQIMIKICSY